MKPMNKKGYGVADIAPMAIMLGLAIVVTVVMANVTSSVADSQKTGAADCNATHDTACNYAYNISRSGMEGLDELGSWFDTIGLVIAAAVIIGILVYAFAFRK